MTETMRHATTTVNAVPIDGTDRHQTAADGYDPAFDRRDEHRGSAPVGRMNGLGDRTADALDATGRYVRNFNSRDTMRDLSEFAKAHPGTSLFTAMLLGLVVGRVMSRPQA